VQYKWSKKGYHTPRRKADSDAKIGVAEIPPGLAPLRWEQMVTIFGYAMVSCLVVNDAVKVILIKRLVPTAVA